MALHQHSSPPGSNSKTFGLPTASLPLTFRPFVSSQVLTLCPDAAANYKVEGPGGPHLGGDSQILFVLPLKS